LGTSKEKEGIMKIKNGREGKLSSGVSQKNVQDKGRLRGITTKELGGKPLSRKRGGSHKERGNIRGIRPKDKRLLYSRVGIEGRNKEAKEKPERGKGAFGETRCCCLPKTNQGKK